MSMNYLLMYSLTVPLIGALVIWISPLKESNSIKKIGLNCSVFSGLASFSLFAFFNKSMPKFQHTIEISWLTPLNLNIFMGIDGISLFFLLLTTLLIPICLLSSWNSVKNNLKGFIASFLLLEFFLISAFCILDLLFFYIFFESVLIPMFLIIGIWGSRERKILASYYFFLYTLIGSILALLAILYIYIQVGTTNYEILLTFKFSFKEQKFIWLAFFLAFASKVPMFPAHLWLPEAHVEAPTAGSVLLAGILLKLGTYAFIRYSLPLCPDACFFFAPLVYTIAALGIVYASITAIRQSDFKRIIAYSSIAHMNLVMLGIFSFTYSGLEGAIVQSISHGFVASALFLIIGIVYDRYKTRLVKYYGGLVSVMPLFSILFFFFTMANISFPGTSSFIGEFLIFVGSFKVNSTITIIGATSIITGGAYSLWLLNRIIYGNLKTQYLSLFLDLNLRELLAFFPLVLGTLLVGVYPKILTDSMVVSVNYLIELIYR